ncbi:hypothetical protein CesoFtcFv8_019160 [Champsocephalus esox]|uniref:Uncharacterized protein n=1 Tax=Champsocephalus esox TaxID=159716 RepID=A0AAN8BHR5_9TELE|nr:hypothetical protein CesoFtcFv8_019160 [Champsocephalus esox]
MLILYSRPVTADTGKGDKKRTGSANRGLSMSPKRDSVPRGGRARGERLRRPLPREQRTARPDFSLAELPAGQLQCTDIDHSGESGE